LELDNNFRWHFVVEFLGYIHLKEKERKQKQKGNTENIPI
jgi:hypothetical protein